MLEALTELGIGGIVLSPDDHFCAVCYGAEGRDEPLILFFAEGLRTGETWLWFVDVADRRHMLERLPPRVAGWETTLADQQLDVVDVKASCSSDSRFSQEEMFHSTSTSAPRSATVASRWPAPPRR